MNAKKIVYIIGVVVCSTLTVIFRVVTLPIALVYEAFDVMANISNEAAGQQLEKIKK